MSVIDKLQVFYQKNYKKNIYFVGSQTLYRFSKQKLSQNFNLMEGKASQIMGLRIKSLLVMC
jgi:hypothetical protein